MESTATVPNLSPVAFSFFDGIARAGGSSGFIGIQENPKDPDDPYVLFYGGWASLCGGSNFRVADHLVFKGQCLESISCSTPALTTARKGARRRSRSGRAIRDSAVLSNIDKDCHWSYSSGSLTIEGRLHANEH